MSIENNPGRDIVEVGTKMSEAAVLFCALLPIGVAVAVLIVGCMQ